MTSLRRSRKPGLSEVERNLQLDFVLFPRLAVVLSDQRPFVLALADPATYWLTGNTLHVDRGENIVG
jgi:hypothetical protein